jgi:hypothetical protein
LKNVIEFFMNFSNIFDLEPIGTMDSPSLEEPARKKPSSLLGTQLKKTMLANTRGLTM